MAETINVNKLETVFDIVKDKLSQKGVNDLKITLGGVDIVFYNKGGNLYADYGYNPDKNAPDDLSALETTKDDNKQNNQASDNAKQQFKDWVEDFIISENKFNDIFNHINKIKNRQQPTKDIREFKDGELYQYEDKKVYVFRKKDYRLENILNQKDTVSNAEGEKWIGNGYVKDLSITEKELKKYFNDNVYKKNESLNPRITENLYDDDEYDWDESDFENDDNEYDYTFYINDDGKLFIDAVNYKWSGTYKEPIKHDFDLEEFKNKAPYIVINGFKKQFKLNKHYIDPILTRFKLYDKDNWDLGFFTVKFIVEPFEEKTVSSLPDFSDFDDADIPF